VVSNRGIDDLVESLSDKNVQNAASAKVADGAEARARADDDLLWRSARPEVTRVDDLSMCGGAQSLLRKNVNDGGGCGFPPG
jgi:hypothetical protein